VSPNTFDPSNLFRVNRNIHPELAPRSPAMGSQETETLATW
jgi:hypothetical protein